MRISQYAIELAVTITTLALAAASVPQITVTDVADEDSNCHDIASSDACRSATDLESGAECVWCECAAVPSLCVTADEAKGLPAGVFNCDATASRVASPVISSQLAEDVAARSTKNTADAAHGLRGAFGTADAVDPKITSSRTYNFGARTVGHVGGEVDKSFCDADSSGKSYSGYVDLSGSAFDVDESKNYFYWFFESRSEDPSKDPLILWLTGGPGCSSTLALLTENGPCSVNAEGTGTVPNPYSWTEHANVIWLDQPAGVGYSYGTTNDKNEEMVGEDAYYFLQTFFQQYPQYAKMRLFIVGESYGGHYAPAIAHRTWLGNKGLKDGLIHINLAGLGIGNGLTDPHIQYGYYAEMAYNNSHGIKTVSEAVYEEMKSATPLCLQMIQTCNNLKTDFVCQSAQTYCGAFITSPYYASGLNPYDIRKECGDAALCYDFSNVEKFLNLDSTRDALHVTSESDSTWVTCNNDVNRQFAGDWMLDYAPFVADLANDGIRVMIYAGDCDFICNYMGNKAWALDLEWNHKEEFNAEDDKEFLDGGLVRVFQSFVFLQVYEAGHMVPSDQPEFSLAMIKEFMKDDIEVFV